MNVIPHQALQSFVEENLDGKSPVKGFLLEMVKRQYYMDTFHVGNLDDPSNPLAMVTVNDNEGLFPLWPYFEKARKFMLYEGGKYLNCSFFEFIEQPTWVVDTLLEELYEQHLATLKKQQQVQAAAAATETKLRNQLRQQRGGNDDLDDFQTS